MNEWITNRLPECETEVLITAVRKYADGTDLKIITTAIYEDGTKTIEDSDWNWDEYTNFEYDETLDEYLIPEGWWEYKHFNPDDVYNNEVDMEVVAWMPLPEPYKESEVNNE